MCNGFECYLNLGIARIPSKWFLPYRVGILWIASNSDMVLLNIGALALHSPFSLGFVPTMFQGASVSGFLIWKTV